MNDAQRIQLMLETMIDLAAQGFNILATPESVFEDLRVSGARVEKLSDESRADEGARR
jgi:hypothetical protein